MLRFVVDKANPHLGGNVEGGDPRTYCPAVWDWAIPRFGVRTALDVGCGEGEAVDYLRSNGVEAIGLDGLARNAERAHRYGPAVVCDLSRHRFRTPVDLVWCCEVVEHVAAEHVDNLIWTLSSGRVVMMTHAVPGQGGHHHVNEREAGYWVGLMRGAGYRLERAESAESRRLAPGTYWAATGLIFTREAP